MTTATTKNALHAIIDELDESAVEELLKNLRAGAAYRRVLAAPLDDEPETEAEREAVSEALEEIRMGRLIPHDEVVREFLGADR